MRKQEQPKTMLPMNQTATPNQHKRSDIGWQQDGTHEYERKKPSSTQGRMADEAEGGGMGREGSQETFLFRSPEKTGCNSKCICTKLKKKGREKRRSQKKKKEARCMFLLCRQPKKRKGRERRRSEGDSTHSDPSTFFSPTPILFSFSPPSSDKFRRSQRCVCARTQA